MLVQTPSRLFRNETRQWIKEAGASAAEIFRGNEGSKLQLMKEILLDVAAEIEFTAEADCTVLLMPLYGEIIINNYYESISAGETLSVKLQKGEHLKIKNHVLNDHSDFILLLFDSAQQSGKYLKTEMDFGRKNCLLPFCSADLVPAFAGLYDGREEETYRLKNKSSEILGFIINGAFEFQNRLMENRDAILLSGIDTLEFEALSENALLLFLEI